RRYARIANPPRISASSASIHSDNVGMFVGSGASTLTVAEALAVCGATPGGAATVATLVKPPFCSVNVPLSWNVIVLFAGNVVSAMPAPCRLGTVTLTTAGQTAPLVALVQVIPDAVKPE